MRTNFLLSFFLLTLFCVSGCGEDEDPVTLDEAFLTVNIDGRTFEAEFATGALNESFGNPIFSIAGLTAQNTAAQEVMAMIFLLPPGESLTTRTYSQTQTCTFSGTDLCISASFGDTADTDEAVWTTNRDMANSDRIDVTISSIRYEVGGDVSGTFSGVLADEDGNLITLTNGRFSVPIQ